MFQSCVATMFQVLNLSYNFTKSIKPDEIKVFCLLIMDEHNWWILTLEPDPELRYRASYYQH